MVDDDVLLGLYKLLRKRSIDDIGPVLIGIYQVFAIHWIIGTHPSSISKCNSFTMQPAVGFFFTKKLSIQA